jgi:hypothetical protein
MSKINASEAGTFELISITYDLISIKYDTGAIAFPISNN